MLLSLREEAEGKLQMLLSHRKNGRTSLFKEVRAFNGEFAAKRKRQGDLKKHGKEDKESAPECTPGHFSEISS